MTLGDGKRRVYMLLDEYSSGGQVTQDADIEAKMADFFDMAQKQLSKVQRIVKSYDVERVSGQTEYAMPEDFSSLRRIWRDGRVCSGRYRWKNGKLLIPEEDTGAVEVEYFASPETIGAQTPDSYVFPLRDDAVNAMCFYVAAQQLVVDLVLDYAALWQMYQLALLEVDRTLPGGVGLRNTFYRRQ